MATKRDLLKEAIEDAKTVKETAIANAKAALEEAFHPFLKEKLSAQLSELEEVDENQSEGSEDTINEEEISLDEILAEISKDDELDEAKKKDTDKDEKKDEKKEDKKEDKKDEKKEKSDDDEEINLEDMSEEDLQKFVMDVINGMIESGELEAGHAESEEAGEEELGAEIATDEVPTEEPMEEPIDEPIMAEEEYDLNELLAELESIGNVDEKVEVDEVVKIKKELEEAYSTIKTLKSSIQEVNLFNAKLLYTNKIFNGKTLNESQKIKVLAAFDKATSKKEVELVYETLTSGLKTQSTIKRNPIKESLSSASKPMLNTTKKPIIEEDKVFSRMQILAGIKPNNK